MHVFSLTCSILSCHCFIMYIKSQNTESIHIGHNYDLSCKIVSDKTIKKTRRIDRNG